MNKRKTNKTQLPAKSKATCFDTKINSIKQSYSIFQTGF